MFLITLTTYSARVRICVYSVCQSISQLIPVTNAHQERHAMRTAPPTPHPWTERNSKESSGARGSHPHALTDPDVTVSHHPAPIVQPTVYSLSPSVQTTTAADELFVSANVPLAVGEI